MRVFTTREKVKNDGVEKKSTARGRRRLRRPKLGEPQLSQGLLPTSGKKSILRRPQGKKHSQGRRSSTLYKGRFPFRRTRAAPTTLLNGCPISLTEAGKRQSAQSFMGGKKKRGTKPEPERRKGSPWYKPRILLASTCPGADTRWITTGNSRERKRGFARPEEKLRRRQKVTLWERPVLADA